MRWKPHLHTHSVKRGSLGDDFLPCVSSPSRPSPAPCRLPLPPLLRSVNTVFQRNVGLPDLHCSSLGSAWPRCAPASAAAAPLPYLPTPSRFPLQSPFPPFFSFSFPPPCLAPSPVPLLLFIFLLLFSYPIFLLVVLVPHSCPAPLSFPLVLSFLLTSSLYLAVFSLCRDGWFLFMCFTSLIRLETKGGLQVHLATSWLDYWGDKVARADVVFAVLTRLWLFHHAEVHRV